MGECNFCFSIINVLESEVHARLAKFADASFDVHTSSISLEQATIKAARHNNVKDFFITIKIKYSTANIQ